MPTYHSSFNKASGQEVCSSIILPLRTKVRGNAPILHEGDDIIDEAIKFFEQMYYIVLLIKKDQLI